MGIPEIFLPTTKRLLVWLFLKALLMGGIILYSGISLGPDEAQYWTWSQALDWGYYSKPPGIAWQIWLGTQVFGQTELGVRFFSIILSFFQALGVYLIALRSGLSLYTAFWCGLLMAFSPIGILGSFFAITDGGMLLCWTGACLSLASSLKEKKEPDPIRIGVWILSGALFKWTIFIFWVFYVIFSFTFFPRQKKGRLAGAILFSLIGVFPSLWWNITHDWATIRHVLATLSGGSVHKVGGNPLEFLGSQALLLSPILFILLLIGLYRLFSRQGFTNPPLLCSGIITFSLLTIVLACSFFQKIQGNWIDFAYPTGLVVVGWYTLENGIKRLFWLKMGLSLSLALGIVFFSLPFLYPKFASSGLNLRGNPLKHNLGWTALGEALNNLGYDSSQHFLFSDKYQTSSILSFYSEGKKRAYFLNLHGTRKNQFSYWPSIIDQEHDKTGFFVWVENMPNFEREWESKLNFYLTQLKYYFEKVEFAGKSPLMDESVGMTKGALIIRCENCNGLEPIISNYY